MSCRFVCCECEEKYGCVTFRKYVASRYRDDFLKIYGVEPSEEQLVAFAVYVQAVVYG